MAAHNKKAEGVAAPTAHVLHLRSCDCARRGGDAQVPGTTTIQTYIGTALRGCRSGLSHALDDGPSTRVARELSKARDALDSALWLCDYVEAER
jgi:hypothetical protein